MRPAFLAALLAFGLLVAPAIAMAAPNSHAKASEAAAADHRAQKDAERANKTLDKDVARANRTAENGTDNETRPAYVTAFVERLRALRASLHENMSKVREGCHAQDFDHQNASKEQRKGWAQCVKNGYAKLFKAHREERKDAREDFREAREAARANRSG